MFFNGTGEYSDLPQGFELKDWYKYSWGIYRKGKPVKVIIRFYNYYETIVQEELSNRETALFHDDNGDLLLEDYVDGLDELAVWLRGYGPGAKVLTPY